MNIKTAPLALCAFPLIASAQTALDSSPPAPGVTLTSHLAGAPSFEYGFCRIERLDLNLSGSAARAAIKSEHDRLTHQILSGNRPTYHQASTFLNSIRETITYSSGEQVGRVTEQGDSTLNLLREFCNTPDTQYFSVRHSNDVAQSTLRTSTLQLDYSFPMQRVLARKPQPGESAIGFGSSNLTYPLSRSQEFLDWVLRAQWKVTESADSIVYHHAVPDFPGDNFVVMVDPDVLWPAVSLRTFSSLDEGQPPASIITFYRPAPARISELGCVPFVECLQFDTLALDGALSTTHTFVLSSRKGDAMQGHLELARLELYESSSAQLHDSREPGPVKKFLDGPGTWPAEILNFIGL